MKKRFKVAFQQFPDEASGGFVHAAVYSLDTKPSRHWDHVLIVEVVEEKPTAEQDQSENKEPE